MSSQPISQMTPPDNLSKTTLKSRLTKMGVELPPYEQTKDYYYHVYMKANQELEKKKLHSENFRNDPSSMAWGNRGLNSDAPNPNSLNKSPLSQETCLKIGFSLSNNSKSNNYEDVINRCLQEESFEYSDSALPDSSDRGRSIMEYMRTHDKENIGPQTSAKSELYLRERINKFNNNKLFKEKGSLKEKVPTPFKASVDKENLLGDEHFKTNVLSKRFPLIERKNSENMMENNQYCSSSSQYETSELLRKNSISQEAISQSYLPPTFNESRDSIPVGDRKTPQFGNTEVSSLRESGQNKAARLSEKNDKAEGNYQRNMRGDSKQSRETLFTNLNVAVIATVMAIILALVYKSVTLPKKYCISGSEVFQGKDCIPCPQHAECENGIIECDDEYELNEGLCQNSYHIAKEKYIKYISKVLSLESGQHICHGDNSITYPAYFYELEKILHSYYGEESLFDEVISLVKSELTSPLQSNQKTVETNGIIFNLESRQFSAKEPTFTIQCKASMFMSQSLFSIAMLAIIVGISLTYLKKYQSHKDSERFAQKIYSEIVIELNKVRVACVKELYAKAARKYGEENVRAVWPLVEALRVKYKRTLVFKDEYQGAYEYFWKI